jgi:RHS repeat-associated protein
VTSDASGTETTLYVGGLLEKVTSGTTTRWRHYVPTPSGHAIVVSRDTTTGQLNSGNTKYLITDHLGSTDTVLNPDGSLVTSLSFDAFGARRGSDWQSGTAPDWTNIAATSRRGFTFHEQLDAVGLIHMNGRVYDSLLGRFLSVDPIIGDRTDSQSINPYAYVGNRALSATDPSGYCEATCVNVIRIVVATALNFAFGGSGAGPPPAFVLPGQSAQYGGGVCEPGNTTLSCDGSILYAGAPNTSGDNVQSSTPYDRIGVPVDIIFEGKAYTITEEVTAPRTPFATQIQTKLVIRANCSPAVDIEYKAFCDTVYPSFLIEDAILTVTGVYGMGRALLATASDAAVVGSTEAALSGTLVSEGSLAARGAGSAIERGAVSGSQRLQLGNMPANAVRNAPANIGGRNYTGHALDQMQNRGMTPSVVENAISTGATRAGNTAAEIRYFDSANNVSVVLDRASGRVVTVRYGD